MGASQGKSPSRGARPAPPREEGGKAQVFPFVSSQYNYSPPQPSGDAPKTRSLDRKHVEPIVLTKWRHSTFVPELGDKVWKLSHIRGVLPGPWGNLASFLLFEF